MSDDPFRAVHRARRQTTAARILAAAAIIAVGASLVSLADAAPASSPTVAAASAPIGLLAREPLASTPPATTPVDESPVLAAVPAVPEAAIAEPAAPPAPAPATLGPASWRISIDTVGYQAELDACLWVRMNLGLRAPIVGAHNYCGGGIVLELQPGDEVALAGTELDGTYVVTEARDAWVGDSARLATEGMTSDVILQTCYWGGEGRLRLVGLARVSGS